tara:strand:- start:924 stop:1463 length:540 start_codon:yes stop_codon:yes gene_type:complete
MKVLSLFFFGFFLTSAFAANSVKIGYIDTNQVIINLPQYQLNIDEISKEFEPKKQKLLALLEEIELLRSNINNFNKATNKEFAQSELTRLNLLEDSFNNESDFWQEKMNDKKNILLQEIELLINNTINDLAITGNYDLILYDDAAFVSEEVNITNMVIEKIQKLSFDSSQNLSNTKLIK